MFALDLFALLVECSRVAWPACMHGPLLLSGADRSGGNGKLIQSRNVSTRSFCASFLHCGNALQLLILISLPS